VTVTANRHNSCILSRRALLFALLIAALMAPASAYAATTAPPRAVLVFLPRPGVLSVLDREPSLALGLLNETQGGYDQRQALLDMTAGTRTSRSTYKPKRTPKLQFVPAGTVGSIAGWPAIARRAQRAPADIVPGLLAGSIPDAGAYVGPGGPDAVVAADRNGSIAATAIGPPSTVAERVAAELVAHGFVVADLPAGGPGATALRQILARRAPRELVIVTQAPPRTGDGQLSPIGIAGLPRNGTLTSQTTHRIGVVAAIDLLPTVLRHAGIKVPDQVKGEPITSTGSRDVAGLRRLAKRLSVLAGRRTPALEALGGAWLALVLLLGLWRDREGVRLGMRWGGLAAMWLPLMLLVTAWIEPSRTAELAILGAGSFALGALTDRLIRWPWAPALPAVAGLAAYTADLVNHSHLISRSLLGSNPRAGSRFYGIGNELEITLTLLLLVGVAALLRRRARGNRAALMFALAGVIVGGILAAGRLGADVGGVFTVGGGTAVAVLLLLPGGITRRAVALAILAPFAGLGVLAVIDLASGGNSHYARTILHANGIGDLRKTFVRRTDLAWTNLHHGLMPFVTVICLLAGAYAIRHRHRVYGALAADPVWTAGLGGAFAAGIVGSLTNDSGPLLLLIGTIGLAALTAYLRSGEAAAIPPADDLPAPPAAALERPPPRVHQTFARR
jgi:hypothetical protein